MGGMSHGRSDSMRVTGRLLISAFVSHAGSSSGYCYRLIGVPSWGAFFVAAQAGS